jgi:hypothetical protein
MLICLHCLAKLSVNFRICTMLKHIFKNILPSLSLEDLKELKKLLFAT